MDRLFSCVSFLMDSSEWIKTQMGYQAELSVGPKPGAALRLPVNEWSIDGHIVRLASEDICIVQYAPSLSADQMGAILRKFYEISDERPYIFSVHRVHRLRHFDPRAREVLPKDRAPKPGAAAVVGASYQIRVILNLCAKALELIKGKSAVIPMRMFETDAEALAWIAERREELWRSKGTP
jgi:hypothetical protein